MKTHLYFPALEKGLKCDVVISVVGTALGNVARLVEDYTKQEHLCVGVYDLLRADLPTINKHFIANDSHWRVQHMWDIRQAHEDIPGVEVVTVLYLRRVNLKDMATPI